MYLRITFRENDPTESRDGRAQRSIRMRVKRNVLPESFLSIYSPHLLPIRFFGLRVAFVILTKTASRSTIVTRFTYLAMPLRVAFCVTSSRISNACCDKQRVSQQQYFQISRRQAKVPFRSNLALKHRLSEISSEII